MPEHNPYCCGSHCSSETAEVRVLPYGEGSHLILCYACFRYEWNYRRDEIRYGRQFELPAWSDLEPYDQARIYNTHKQRGIHGGDFPTT